MDNKVGFSILKLKSIAHKLPDKYYKNDSTRGPLSVKKRVLLKSQRLTKDPYLRIEQLKSNGNLIF